MRISKSLPCAMGIGIGALALVSGIAAAEEVAALPTPVMRDGRHDFDFNFGVWKTHIRRLRQPLSGSTRPAPSRRSRLTEAVPGK